MRQELNGGRCRDGRCGHRRKQAEGSGEGWVLAEQGSDTPEMARPSAVR